VIKGACLINLGRVEEGLQCCEKALELDAGHALGWYIKAAAEERLGHIQEAALSFRQFISLAPGEYAVQIESAHEALQDLEGK